MNIIAEICMMLVGPAVYVAVAFVARWRWPRLKYRAWTSGCLMAALVALHASEPLVVRGRCMPTYPPWFHIVDWTLHGAFVCAFASILAGILYEWTCCIAPDPRVLSRAGRDANLPP